MNARKGRSKNKKQRDAADAAAAAAELAELLRKRKRSGGSTDDSSPKRHKHVPQKVGRGGVREKLDVEQLDSPSRKAVLQLRERVARHRLKHKTGGVVEHSDGRRVHVGQCARWGRYAYGDCINVNRYQGALCGICECAMHAVACLSVWGREECDITAFCT